SVASTKSAATPRLRTNIGRYCVAPAPPTDIAADCGRPTQTACRHPARHPSTAATTASFPLDSGTASRATADKLTQGRSHVFLEEIKACCLRPVVGVVESRVCHESCRSLGALRCQRQRIRVSGRVLGNRRAAVRRARL